MPLVTRRHVLASGAAMAASIATPAPLRALMPAPLQRPDDWYVPEQDLPVLELDPAASAAKGRIMARGRSLGDLEWGAVIMAPPGMDIPARWWGLRVGRTTNLRDGARIVLRGAGAANRSRLVTPGKEGALELQNLSPVRVKMQVEDLEIAAGTGGDAIRIDRVSNAELRRLRITGGKNGVFATHHPTDILMEDCEVRHGGRGDGYTHNVYTGYVRSLTLRRCHLHSPTAPGHCFKCYAQTLDVRGNIFAHYDTLQDLLAGKYGGLPLIDRGAWGHTIFADNLLIRRGPVRPTVIDLRNRSFPAGFRKHVQAGWGTAAIPFAQVDNRDPANPYLFRHLFHRNTLQNGLLPDGLDDPYVQMEPGIFLRNNGSAPWRSDAGGNPTSGEEPPDWQPHNERCVAYLSQNRFEGTPPALLAQRWAYRQRRAVTPVHEWPELPAWARDWAGL